MVTQSQQWWIAAVCLIVFPFSARADAIQQVVPKPNIVLIMADDIGRECFGCYGSTQYQTPHLDRLAAEGIRFTHCYSQPLCTPSRVMLMTGLSNARNYSAFSVLNRDQKTFGHFLREAGYATLVAGKWQLFGSEQYTEQFRGKGVLPREAGFDRCCLWQVDKLGSRYWEPLLHIDGGNKQFSSDQYGPDIVSDHVVQFITENRQRPFFVYYPMILVHNPFEPTPNSSSRKAKNKQKNFEDMVKYMDKIVGKISGHIEKLGLSEQTLLLFVGDNGTNKEIRSKLEGTTIRGGKGKTTDAGTRVSLIGHWPGTIPASHVTDTLVEFSDFLPTFLDVAGSNSPANLDGQSFLPQLKGEMGTPREWISCFYCPRPERTVAVRYVRDQRWKLYGNGQLFDVAADPLENTVIVPSSETPESSAARLKLTKALESIPSEGRSLLKFAP